MYLYIFDSFLVKKKYKKILDKIETRITDLEISGRIIRLTILESIEEIIKEAIKRGVETIVVVGNDKTFCQAASAMVNSGVVLGFIPINEETKLAKILGLPKNELACEVISARLVENIDSARINHYFFLSSVQIKTAKIILKTPSYTIFPFSQIDEIKISNLDSLLDGKGVSNPKDNFVEVIFQKPISSFLSFFKFSQEKIINSFFLFKKINVESPKKKKEVPVLVDGWRVLKTPLEIEVVPSSLKVIVGKERKF
ncbi:MAG: diacylglycerol kinase family protein [Patescibacteria group bacterium]|nr:diacylglycerol kinase family protein [Patescibacteria group bacterium]